MSELTKLQGMFLVLSDSKENIKHSHECVSSDEGSSISSITERNQNSKDSQEQEQSRVR